MQPLHFCLCHHPALHLILHSAFFVFNVHVHVPQNLFLSSFSYLSSSPTFGRRVGVKAFAFSSTREEHTFKKLHQETILISCVTSMLVPFSFLWWSILTSINNF